MFGMLASYCCHPLPDLVWQLTKLYKPGVPSLHDSLREGVWVPLPSQLRKGEMLRTFSRRTI